METDTLTRRRHLLVDWGLPLALAVSMLGPLLLGRGFALVGDMVFVPDQPWKPGWIGADGSVPRAVPGDAVTWALGTVLPGDLVQKFLLLAMVVLAGAGAARLTRGHAWPARSAAVVLATWNPFVHERLAIGHWALLLGYAMLPWVVVGAQRVRAGTPGGWRAVTVPLAVAAWSSPTGGVLATVVLLAVLAPRARLLLSATALAAVVNLPWLLAGIVNAGAVPADAFGVEAFAARADSPWGVLGSLLGMGGIWKEAVVPGVRGAWLLSGLSLLLVVAAFVALVRVRPLGRPLLGLGAFGLLLALLPATAVGQPVAEWLVTTVPGGGILRDSQKWVALALPGLCLGTAAAVERCAAWVRDRGGSALPVLIGWALLPVLVLPTSGWGHLGTLAPHDYPHEWHQVRDRLEAEGAADDRILVVPFGLYRRFDWNGGHAVLDPAPRFFPGDVITDDALVVDGGTVAGEDALSDAVRRAADDRAALTALLVEERIGWVVAHAADGRVDAVLPEGDVVHRGERLAVVRVAGVADRPSPELHAWLAGVDVGVLVVVGVVVLPWRRLRMYSRGRERE